ncbi:MAG: hypothetical protein EPO51_16595 [Phenylobacterium sp.]|uniref:hypothetical protein n=1 Tax=Phenylobacterium sp. TaxID=1871053 RepID=UPI00121376CE|nr:hypothetical protein [Phenylobacterium sp.]TAJ70707.1 MAG: hypothetical protein EPO51_16595 [Phenylobacterium sp.]
MDKAFMPVDNATVTVSVSTSSQPGAIKSRPTGAFQLRLHNSLAGLVFYRVGDSGVQATAADVPLPAGAVEVITVKNSDSRPDTHIAFIAASGAGAVYASTGNGI